MLSSDSMSVMKLKCMKRPEIYRTRKPPDLHAAAQKNCFWRELGATYHTLRASNQNHSMSGTVGESPGGLADSDTGNDLGSVPGYSLRGGSQGR